METKIENNYDFTKEKINVMYNREILNISFEEIEKMLSEKCTLRSSIPFAVWGKERIITQATNIAIFAQDFKFFLNQKMYFNSDSIFKMNIEAGSVNLFNLT